MINKADEHPAATLLMVGVLLYVGLFSWSLLSPQPVLLGRLEATERATIYGQFASSAVALLAVSMTVLAILVALPDRESVKLLREGPAWPRIQAFLLCSALLCLLTLVASHLAAAIDVGAGIRWLQMLVCAGAAMSVISVLAGGLAFGLFLRKADEPSDPSVGRGSGQRRADQ